MKRGEKMCFVKVLWTGGFDSTYRVLQLSRDGVDIQPYYVHHPERGSASIELERIDKITRIINDDPSLPGKVLPLKVIPHQESPEDKYDRARHAINIRNFKTGKQYSYIARHTVGIEGLEYGVDRDVGKANTTCTTLRILGKLEYVDEFTHKYYRLVQEGTDPALLTLFGTKRFPLMEIDKQSMKKDYEDWGYKHIMDLTWFCNAPIQGEVCGICVPCRYASKHGFFYRLPRKAKLRYRKYQIKQLLKKTPAYPVFLAIKARLRQTETG